MDLAWLTLAALVLVVLLSCTSRVNPGIIAIGLAWLLAACAAPGLGQSLGKKPVAEGFPAELFLTLVGVSLLFAQAEANGTLSRVATAAERLCGGYAGLTPILFFGLALAIGSAGPGNIAAAGLVAPIAMAAARRAGISPLVMALLVGHGAIATSVSPFTAAGVVANQKLAAIGVENAAWRIFAWNVGANALAAAAGYVLFRGWRHQSRVTSESDAPRDCGARSDPPAGDDRAAVSLEPRHAITLVVIGAVVCAVVGLGVEIGLAAFVGAALIGVLHLADERETLLRLPWGVLLMVCGVSVLTSLLEKSGGTARFASLIGCVATPATLAPLVALITGIVSIYSSTTGVVLPAFLPMVQEVAATQPGSDPLNLALAVLVGGNLVDMSPLSTIGALCLAAAPAESDRRQLFNRLLAWGFAMALLGAAIAWICF